MLKNSFQQAENVFHKIASGDLPERLTVKSNDEIGILIAHLNTAIDSTNDMIKRLKKEVKSMEIFDADLSSNTIETAGALQQLETNIEGVKEQAV